MNDLFYQFRTLYPELQINFNIATFPLLDLPKVLLHILFQNLISNAIKYRRKEVVLSISVDYEIINQEITFIFKDNGIGIEENQYANIFKPFKRLLQNDAEGHGLGLAFCKKIIVSMGGNISVSSKVNHGTIFHLTTPLKKI